MAAHPPEYGIAAVARTAALVAAMMRLGPSPLTRLAAEANCTAANAFRILHTLNALGLAAQDGRRGPWQLGVGWLAVSRAAEQQDAIPLASRPVLAEFSERIGEAVSLAMRDGEQCVIAAAYPADLASRPFCTMGERWPLHAGPGRLLLAYAPAVVQRGVLASRLGRLGPATRTDAPWVNADLPRIRDRNWLITINEIDADAVTVSTAVRGRDGAVIAALSIVSSAVRLGPLRPHGMVTQLIEAAAELGRVLG